MANKMFGDTTTPELLWVDPDPTWRTQAACRTEDSSLVELFFDWRTVKEAELICASCVVSDRCATFAANNNERFGVWGGERLG
jgi:hypothetical protein